MKPIEEMKRGEIKGRIRNGSLDDADLFLLLRNKKKYKFFFMSVADSRYIQNYEILDALIKGYRKAFGGPSNFDIGLLKAIFLSKKANEEIKNYIIKIIMKNKIQGYNKSFVVVPKAIHENAPKGVIKKFAEIYKVDSVLLGDSRT